MGGAGGRVVVARGQVVWVGTALGFSLSLGMRRAATLPAEVARPLHAVAPPNPKVVNRKLKNETRKPKPKTENRKPKTEN